MGKRNSGKPNVRAIFTDVLQLTAGRLAPAEELEYEVAGILDLKIERRRLKYLADWVNCGPKLRESSREGVSGSETFIESKLRERV
jgi:hypothetical protein